MNLESFASRIMDIKEYTWSQKVPAKLRQMRFQIKNTNMRLTSVNRTQFAGLNDKRYYLPDGITSLPYGHFLMSEMREKKKQYKLIQNVIMKIKDDLIREESKIFAKCERLRVLKSVLLQLPTYYKIESNKRPNVKNIIKSTKEYILSGIWQ